MIHSTKPKYRKYVEGYGFLSFARTLGDNYVKKLMDTATKTGIDAAKAADESSIVLRNVVSGKFSGKTKSIIY